MPCLVALIALFTPRIAIILLVIFSDYIGQAYNTNVIPFLGFLIMPFTTLAYAFSINANGTVSGFYLVLVVIAVLADLGLLGGSARVGVAKTGRTPN